ncbi:unnamed protein product, partial [Candidula unifasciata]
FVRNLLADFTVDINTTRVSVITFSSPHKIFRHIDYLTHPVSDNHKCRLLNEDIQHVDYTPGGTHTLGAFLEAEKVLKSARPDAAKAIFLMTDGYSNGGDPRPVASKLKRQGVKIFTFGIRDGFVWELEDMASEPKNETCYILDSFEEFEALAKRALHTDLQSGSYVEQSSAKCNELCTKESLCCHENAICSCGTYTGKYECLCKPGYYGTGRGKTGCKPCHPGTYKNFTGLGDSNICASCPDEHQTTPAAAISVQQCVCKRGYRSFGNKECTVFRCPELSPPKHGYFVNNVCNNVFNAACGLRCQHGYELRGSSLRICQDDGTWSGQDAECIMKTCPSLPVPKNGHMICSSDDFSYSSVCRFTCNAGYQLVGSRKRNCLAIAYWTGIATRCREITCPPLVDIKDGTITPASCTTREVVFGSTCQISCSSGYVLKGPHTKQCTPDGTWMSAGEGINQCVDETPPVLDCPRNVEVVADEFTDMTEVIWTAPVPVDNSGFRPVLTSEPAVTPGSRFPIGTTYVTYKAEDLSQNVAKCRFFIRVIDKTPPTVDKCVSPSPIISKREHTKVVLEPPLFSDNSGKPVEVVSSHLSEELFPWGTTAIVYRAFDASNNNSTCTIEVVVVPHLCVIPQSPANGNVSCVESDVGILCHIHCNDGFAFALPSSDEYFCDYEEGRWMPESMFPFPDCAVVQISNDIIQPATITLTGDNLCKDKLLLQRIQHDLEGRVEDKLSSVCENDLSCSIGSLTSVCEEDEDYNKIPLVLDNKRKRRSLQQYSHGTRETRHQQPKKSRLTFGFKLEGSVKKPKHTDVGKSPQLSESLVKMLASLQKEAGLGKLDLSIGDQTLTFSEMYYDAELQTYQCHNGSVLVNGTCVNCPVGTYYNDISRLCEDCPKGMYQHKEGQNTCMKCPGVKSTVKSHARSETECLGLCLPGTFSSNGLEPCETCHLGFYQPDHATQYCHPCSHGQTTHRRGAHREEDCTDICPPGLVSSTGLAPCFPCPHNSFQPKFGQTECFRCPEDSNTTNVGETSLDACIFTDMQSDAGVKKGGGGQQRFAFHICLTDICQNGGTCEPLTGASSFRCVCPKSFTGTRCENALDFCEAKPCHNGGICLPTPGGFQCDCMKGFTGTNCEINIDECASLPCANKGTCVDGINSFTCNCPVGYTGRTCSATINDCADAPCRNGGTCVNAPPSFKCQCVVGYTGETCELDIDECMSAPCQNGGNCKDLVGIYSCECKGGFTGKNCEAEINECADSPCQNGAVCEDLLDDYTCKCAAGYTGKKCEKALTSQYQLDFADPSIMDYAQLNIEAPMTSVTVSFWLRTTDREHQGTPFSYAVHGEPNAFTITDYNNLNLIINGEEVSIALSLNDGQWHHVVLTWSSLRGDWKIYVDGVLKDQGYNLSTAKPIPGKGIFIVGQEQDTFGGGFSSRETFFGTLTQLNVWDQELTLQDVDKMRFSCEDFNGNVISWPSVQAAIKGNLGSSSSSFCTGSLMQTQHNSVTCQRDGSWDRSVPSCDPQKCGPPPEIPNGEPWTSNAEYNVGEAVRYQCDFGYEFNPDVPGANRAVACLPSGEWETELPICIPIKCPDPPIVPNAVASGQDRTFLSVVNYTCNPGYEPVGKSVIKCEEKKDWSSLTFKCVPLDCGQPPALRHGSITGDIYKYNYIIDYQCTTGYVLVGEESRRCEESGKWSGSNPVCQPVSCGDVPSITNGQVTSTTTTYLSAVQYLCDPGFVIQGSSEIICDASGLWVPEAPTCEPRACQQPVDIDFGSFSSSGRFVYNTTLEYSCNIGYLLQGESKMTCQKDGTWSAPTPTCQQIQCPLLDNPINGRVSVIGRTFSSIAGYTCNKGFRLVGVDARTCQADGTWSSEAPKCQSINCLEPDHPTNGRVDYKDLSIGSIVRYYCNRGYLLEGDTIRRCQDNLTLSGEPPSCRPVNCGSPGDLNNGIVSFSDKGTVFEAVATAVCNEGYTLKGAATRNCGSDGKWSGQKPECIRVECSKVTNFISNGRTNSTDSFSGATVLYSCDTGYIMEGSPIRRCKPDGNWDEPIPSCVAVECPIPRIINGHVSSFQRSFGTVIKFTCKQNHRLKGPSERTCQENGQWSGDTPECVKIKCEPPAEVPNTKTTVLNDTAIKYECLVGYNLVGESVRVCGENEVWFPEAPVCETVTCEDLSSVTIANGTIVYTSNKHKEFVSYTCNTGYTLKGEERRQCLANGQWDGSEPTCEIVSCGHPGILFNGHVQQADYTFNSTVEFSCDEGYRLVGVNSLFCTSDGLWEGGEFPSCERIFCPELSPTITEGSVSVPVLTVGGIAEYKCNSGFLLIGNASRECLNTGQWSGKEPFCANVFCTPPPAVANAIMEGDKFGTGDAIFYTCGEGYHLYGDFTRVCQPDGSWSNEAPECLPVNCPEPDGIDYGWFLGESGVYTARITYECEEGYELVGSHERFCQANATWSGSDPECRRVSCGTPPAIANAVMDQTENLLFTDAVSYSCLEGYTELGLDTTTCLSNRSWSFIDYTCTIISCPSLSPDEIPHGTVNVTSFTYGSDASFYCDEGYLLSGSSQTFCTAQGIWSESLPICQIVQCPELTALTHGQILSVSTTFGSTASFVCNIGYRLTGAEVIECLSTGQWNESQPVCQIVSCFAPPLSIPNGQLVSPKPDYVYTDIVSYSCDFGYELNGPNSLTCLETGYFDLPPPDCLRTPCPPPDTLGNSTFTLLGNDTVYYECGEGFELVGKSTLECLLGGTWDGLVPSCVPLPCPEPDPIAHGWIESTEFVYGHTITYFCDPGFYLENSSVRVCMANQTWSGTEPRCSPVSCGQPPEAFPNGVITGEYLFGGKAEYKCLPGFELSGESTRQCQADGTWSSTTPSCLRLACPAPGQLVHGSILGTSFLFEDSVTYTCEEGYVLKGDSVRTCEASLTWSGSDPVCERISCGVPTAPANGALLGDSYLFDDQINVTCNIGYRLVGSEHKICEASGVWSGADSACEQLFCSEPPVILGTTSNATVGLDLYQVYSVIAYQCGKGHVMNGTGLKTCEPSAVWSDNYLECFPVTCLTVESIQNGLVIGEAYTYLSTVEFVCNEGFELVGNSSAQCNENGSWNSEIPYCSIVTCPTLSIENGYFVMNSNETSNINITRDVGKYIYGDVITFSCDTGYDISGVLKSQCQLNGVWSVTDTTCTPVQCSEPTGIDHAVFGKSALTYRSTLEVSCIAGYDLIGESELTCGAEGLWEEAFPKCVLLVCGSPPSVPNAVIEGDSFKQGDTITYKCKSGYELIGNSLLTCGTANAWLGSSPSCVEIDCGPPPVLPESTVTVGKTTFRSAAQLVCNTGYILKGNATMVCSSNRSWKYDAGLLCAPVDCGKPPSLPHSVYTVNTTILGSVVEYMCEKGHFMEGQSSLFCHEDGSWVYEYPVCSAVDCLEPPAVDHTTRISNGTVYNSVVNYTCFEGYSHVYANRTSLVCGDMASWLGELPVCEVVDCGTPSDFPHAFYLLDNNRTDYFSYAIYHCDTGYKTEETNLHFTCGSAGQWEGNAFKCEPVECSDVPSILYADNVIMNETTFGAQAYFSCSSGFVNTGPDYIVCTETGQWSVDQHACLPVECQEPQDPEFGIVEYNSTTYTSSATFSCLPGYSLAGNTTAECLATGVWSAVAPICLIVDCLPPPEIEHGNVSFSLTTYQSSADYSCSPGYKLSNSSTLICVANASWYGEMPLCTPVACPELQLQLHGKVIYSTLTYQSTVTFSCEQGFRLVGETNLTCLENGTWSNQPPQCLPQDCSQPLEIKHGEVLISGTTFGSSATYKCNEGFVMEGSNTVFCDADGAWNSSAPICKIVDCKPPPKITQGIILFTSTTYLSVATYQCNKGYRLAGAAAITCGASGDWEAEGKPHCELVACPEPPHIPNGLVSFLELKYGSAAYYTCNTGYSLNGSFVIHCGSNGTWDKSPPVCTEPTCPTLQNISNGFVKISGSRVGADANYSCSTGFYVEGENRLVCLKNQSWSSEPPACKRVNCAAPPVIANAIIIADSGRNVSSKVTYTCVKGYQMVNDQDNEIAITCADDGDWFGKIPSCEIVVCYDQPPVIFHSTFVTNGDTYTSEAIYTCDPGYTMSGNHIIKCDHTGQWSTDHSPLCVPIPCGLPPTFDHSSYEGSDFTYSQSVSYTCDPGHDLIGNSVSICDITGRWSPVAFTCQVRHCSSVIPVPQNGEIVKGTNVGTYIVGSAVEFSCHQGFTLVGSRKLICSESGEWDSSPPQCLYIIDLCSEKLELDNVLPPPPGKVAGDEIFIQCQKGYKSVGNMTSVCQSDNSWSIPQGRCERVYCGEPEVDNVQTTKVLGRNYYSGDSVMFMCRYGYLPAHGQPVLTCLDTGKWDRKAECV